ncbi:prolyl oligopeptidase family serine peptidase [Cyclobacterium marinum]|uniref:prolyl oligopeptidase n=1 Tax=Cyclobacterium marinum (strain ATCC 25205 / DSM 745 / LMG 13164 / NCIMB 1802) TaxID=880070 RepID=G0J2N1_CYCMS|nr:peptidase S9A prolyl oligopeptidase domain protein beta-propeller [Cyclobacterium marinum DSM 745]
MMQNGFILLPKLKNKRLLCLTILTLACTNENHFKPIPVEYPITKKSDHVDLYWGEEVADPYRWLEDDYAENTKEWVIAQNKVTFDYLDKITFREAIRERLEKVWNYEKVGAPFFYGEWTYYFKNDGLQNQSVLYRSRDEGNEEVFLDPNKLSEDGSTSLSSIAFTKDGSLFAYAVSIAGSDWRDIYVMDTESKTLLKDQIKDAKFTGISWEGKKGFYYSTYAQPDGSKLSAVTNDHRLYFHELGTTQAEDVLVFGNDETPKRYVSGTVTEDGQVLVISAANSTTGNELYIKDLSKAGNIIKPIVANMNNNHGVLDHREGWLLVQTNKDAPNNQLVKIDLNNPEPQKWQVLIPEQEEVMQVSKGGGKLFATYLKDAISEIRQYDYEGKEESRIELPGAGTVSGFSSKKTQDSIYYSFTSYVQPGSIYRYSIREGKSKLYRQPQLDFDPEAYENHQVFYTSKDGTKVPMIITHKKSLALNGKNPTILYGYGGFNISLTPAFSIANTVWLENGGIYAVPNIRGGGEYGENWHKAGTKLQKQNVFDDFIAAGEYLIREGYTSSDYLAIKGGSNGGLLVGATMIQRPDLARVALAAVGVMDMLRYHQFTAGAGWAYDYGTADESEEMYRYLKNYSPVHALKQGTAYPSTLVTTADHDDRVVPAHSFKFAAALQEAHKGELPVLIRIETNAGHGAGKPTSKVIEEQADIFAFTLYNMGVDFGGKSE